MKCSFVCLYALYSEIINLKVAVGLFPKDFFRSSAVLHKYNPLMIALPYLQQQIFFTYLYWLREKMNLNKETQKKNKYLGLSPIPRIE